MKSMQEKRISNGCSVRTENSDNSGKPMPNSYPHDRIFVPNLLTTIKDSYKAIMQANV